jgi:hypothetical protein
MEGFLEGLEGWTEEEAEADGLMKTVCGVWFDAALVAFLAPLGASATVALAQTVGRLHATGVGRDGEEKRLVFTLGPKARPVVVAVLVGEAEGGRLARLAPLGKAGQRIEDRAKEHHP